MDCTVTLETLIKWRARSQSHVIDYGYKAIEDITLARAEMRLALAAEIY